MTQSQPSSLALGGGRAGDAALALLLRLAGRGLRRGEGGWRVRLERRSIPAVVGDAVEIEGSMALAEGLTSTSLETPFSFMTLSLYSL